MGLGRLGFELQQGQMAHRERNITLGLATYKIFVFKSANTTRPSIALFKCITSQYYSFSKLAAKARATLMEVAISSSFAERS
jgi:hypothetical protein